MTIMKKRWAVVVPKAHKPAVWCDTESKFVEAWLANQPCSVHWRNAKANTNIGKCQEVFYSGGRRWTRNGQLHRDRGPAVIWGNGEMEYFIEGNFQKTVTPCLQ